MDIGGALAFWSVLVVPTALLLLGLSVRRVGTGELVVVTRRGRVARTRGGGMAARLPGLEDFSTVQVGAQVLPLVVRATTKDATDVVVIADLTVAVDGVPTGVPFHDPAGLAVRRAEDVVAEAVAAMAVDELGALLVDDEPGSRRGRGSPVPRLLARIDGRLPAGTRARDLLVIELEARLTAPVARALGRWDRVT